METKSEREIDMKMDSEILMKIKGNLPDSYQLQLSKCNELIAVVEKRMNGIVEMLRQQGLNDEQKANQQAKIDEEKDFLNKLYEIRKKTENIIKELEKNK